ncbi:hypothetical protein C8R44DRAFT_852275 [Mycena epipterygia]|nr:hypothetical protein C8R44DRAFT_852274 [Mycena epipterygia]KAJ7124405.1 hypothetical protein C8R44DRAFT_852275 [Mycena epipterygia]
MKLVLLVPALLASLSPTVYAVAENAAAAAPPQMCTAGVSYCGHVLFDQMSWVYDWLVPEASWSATTDPDISLAESESIRFGTNMRHSIFRCSSDPEYPSLIKWVKFCGEGKCKALDGTGASTCF